MYTADIGRTEFPSWRKVVWRAEPYNGRTQNMALLTAATTPALLILRSTCTPIAVSTMGRPLMSPRPEDEDLKGTAREIDDAAVHTHTDFDRSRRQINQARSHPQTGLLNQLHQADHVARSVTGNDRAVHDDIAVQHTVP